MGQLVLTLSFSILVWYKITSKSYFGRKRLTDSTYYIRSKSACKLKYYNFINLGDENIPKINLVRSLLSLTDAHVKYDPMCPIKKKLGVYDFAFLRNKITYREILLRKIAVGAVTVT